MDTAVRGDFRIEKADELSVYEGLRALWNKVFGDSAEYIDAFYSAFGKDIEGYAVLDKEDRVVSSLTCYKCGVFAAENEGSIGSAGPDDVCPPDSIDGVPVYVSYAVCTDPDHRGLGLAGELVIYVRNLVTSPAGPSGGKGGVSLISPAEDSLIGFYENLGYSPFFYADQEAGISEEYDPASLLDEDDDFEPVIPGFSAEPVDARAYNTYREAFLADLPHVRLSEAMMEAVRAESMDGNGLLLINGGDAVCTVMQTEEGLPYGAELLVNPVLKGFSMEIDTEIAAKLAEHFDIRRFSFIKPGDRRCQSMIYTGGAVEAPAYFGFPLE